MSISGPAVCAEVAEDGGHAHPSRIRPRDGGALRPAVLRHFGAQRSGTTSLYKALTCHPYVIPARVKEVHYFDKHFDEQSIWYQSHFPNRWALEPTHQHRVHKITGEATPDYMYYEEVPARVRGLLPDVRLVAILRDPAARAYSHYQHEVALGFETLGFREALEHESGASRNGPLVRARAPQLSRARPLRRAASTMAGGVPARAGRGRRQRVLLRGRRVRVPARPRAHRAAGRRAT